MSLSRYKFNTPEPYYENYKVMDFKSLRHEFNTKFNEFLEEQIKNGLKYKSHIQMNDEHSRIELSVVFERIKE